MLPATQPAPATPSSVENATSAPVLTHRSCTITCKAQMIKYMEVDGKMVVAPFKNIMEEQK